MCQLLVQKLWWTWTTTSVLLLTGKNHIRFSKSAFCILKLRHHPSKRMFSSSTIFVVGINPIHQDDERRPLHQSTISSQPPNKLILRNATIDDIDILLHWDKTTTYLQDPNIMGDIDYNDWNWKYELSRNINETIKWRRQYIAVLLKNATDSSKEEIPIGVVQIIDPQLEETQYWGTNVEPNWRAIDIWIGDTNYVGQGYGTEMMKLAFQDDFIFGNSNVKGVKVDPMATNMKAHSFYQKLGFVPDNEYRMFGPDRCLVHRLTRDDYNKMIEKWKVKK